MQNQQGGTATLRALLRTIRWEAEGVNAYELIPLPGEHFPPFAAGAHIELHLAPGLRRAYSLCNDPADRDRYEIAVHLSPSSRGGSRHVHEQWRPGQIVEFTVPRNHFPLDEAAAESILIAGGIGITPMLPMIARLRALGRPWRLYYVTRQRTLTAFRDTLEAHEEAELIFDGEPGAAKLDVAAIIRAAGPQTHLYCCGPAGMLQAFEQLTANRPAGTVHREYFSAEPQAARTGGYTLDLRRSGKTVQVEPGETMLDALLTAGADIGFACSEGICGTCEVRVLEGIPDHRDHFLSLEAKAANEVVMICCSGARTPCLVLDL